MVYGSHGNREQPMTKDPRTPSTPLSLRSRLWVHVHHLAIAATIAWVFWLFLHGR